jgi:hypothetical protein
MLMQWKHYLYEFHQNRCFPVIESVACFQLNCWTLAAVVIHVSGFNLKYGIQLICVDIMGQGMAKEGFSIFSIITAHLKVKFLHVDVITQ